MADRTDNPTDPVAARIADYMPSRRAAAAVWSDIADWVTETVTAAAPSTPAMADRLLSAASGLAAWAHGESIPKDAWLSDRTIERYVATGGMGATVRSRLRRLAERPGPRADRPTAIGARDYAPPLPWATVAAAIHVLSQLPAGPKRHDGLVVIYGAGFVGMDPTELRHWTPDWLTGDTVAIPKVGALTARTVPIPTDIARALSDLADGGDHLLGGGDTPAGPNAPSAALAPLRAAGMLLGGPAHDLPRLVVNFSLTAHHQINELKAARLLETLPAGFPRGHVYADRGISNKTGNQPHITSFLARARAAGFDPVFDIAPQHRDRVVIVDGAVFVNGWMACPTLPDWARAPIPPWQLGDDGQRRPFRVPTTDALDDWFAAVATLDHYLLPRRNATPTPTGLIRYQACPAAPPTRKAICQIAGIPVTFNPTTPEIHPNPALVAAPQACCSGGTLSISLTDPDAYTANGGFVALSYQTIQWGSRQWWKAFTSAKADTEGAIGELIDQLGGKNKIKVHGRTATTLFTVAFLAAANVRNVAVWRHERRHMNHRFGTTAFWTASRAVTAQRRAEAAQLAATNAGLAIVRDGTDVRLVAVGADPPGG